MPLKIRHNLPEDVIAILQLIKRYRRDLAANRVPFDMDAALGDLETHLCDFLSSMISSPLTGRMFLSPPQAYVSDEIRQHSMTVILSDQNV